MRKFLLTLGIAVLAFVAACVAAAPPERSENTTAASEQEQQDNAPRISLADAKKDFDDQSAVIVDVRSAEAYKQEHIKGALNLAKGASDEQLNKIPKGKKIIAYCS